MGESDSQPPHGFLHHIVLYAVRLLQEPIILLFFPGLLVGEAHNVFAAPHCPFAGLLRHSMGQV
jgi:hypothetical protein